MINSSSPCCYQAVLHSTTEQANPSEMMFILCFLPINLLSQEGIFSPFEELALNTIADQKGKSKC